MINPPGYLHKFCALLSATKWRDSIARRTRRVTRHLFAQALKGRNNRYVALSGLGQTPRLLPGAPRRAIECRSFRAKTTDFACIDTDGFIVGLFSQSPLRDNGKFTHQMLTKLHTLRHTVALA
jgi:hypothetical protein